jgi:hypothetical protein
VIIIAHIRLKNEVHDRSSEDAQELGNKKSYNDRI